MNYVDRYQNREIMIVEKWINNIRGLKDIVKFVNKANTGFHDVRVGFIDNRADLIIEVKEDEFYWYNRTGNLGFDYISAFTYNNDNIRNFAQQNNLWIKPSSIAYFLDNITIHKMGKLVTCDADIQLFYVENKGEVILLNAYFNSLLQAYLPNIQQQYSMRINNKKIYDSRNDTWESSAYFINPNQDQKLKELLINDINKLFN